MTLKTWKNTALDKLLFAFSQALCKAVPEDQVYLREALAAYIEVREREEDAKGNLKRWD